MVAIRSTPILYRYGLSVWAGVAELAIAELYAEGTIEQKTVNIPAGENFAPSFLEINEKATVPTLTVGNQTFKDTETVLKWLVENAPVSVQGGDYDLIRKIHDEAYNPNMALLFARDEDELKAKSAGFPKVFAQGRQDALERYSVTPEGGKYSDFYADKKAANGALLALYNGTASKSDIDTFIKQSNITWANIIRLITVELPGILPKHGFMGGERPGQTDFHYAGYLARIAMTQGVEHVQDLEKSLGKPVPEKVVAYWNAWSVRGSWKKVYEETLH